MTTTYSVLEQSLCLRWLRCLCILLCMDSRLDPLQYLEMAHSLWSIPVDVLEYHVLALLSIPSLICCSLVCRRWRTGAKRWTPTKIVPPARNAQEEVLYCLFAEGCSLDFLRWFEKHLRFPVASNFQMRFLNHCLFVASKGSYTY